MKPQKWLLFFGMMSFTLILFVIGWDAHCIDQERLNTFNQNLINEIQSFILEVEKKSDHALAMTDFLRMAQKGGVWGDREVTHQLCQKMLESFSQLSAVFVLYEPDADQQDAKFAQHSAPPIHTGPRGQFASLWIRDTENQGRAKAANYWASGLHHELKNVQASLLQQNRPITLITEPKHDEFMNMRTYYITPIIIEGTMMGVCGVELHLESFYKEFKKFGLYPSSSVFLLSQKKRIISSTLHKQFHSVHINDLYLDTNGQPIPDIYKSVNGNKEIDSRKESSFPKSTESRTLSLFLKRYFAKSTLKQKHITMDTIHTQQPVLVVSAPIASTGWHIIGYVPKSVFKRKLLEGVLQRSVVALSLLALAFAVVALTIGRANAQEAELRMQMQAIRKGDLDPNYFNADEYTGDHVAIVEEVRRLVIWFSESFESLKNINLSIAATMSKVALQFEQCSTSHQSMITSLDKHEIILNERAESAQEFETRLSSYLKDAEIVYSELETYSLKLDILEKELQQLEASSDLFSSRLNLINEKAQDIYKVVNLMNAITDKTNLLSFNASIEAEKATQHASGFIAVSGKLRRLSDQTMAASREIDERVKELHNSVFSGVVELDKFSKAIGHTIKHILQSTEGLRSIFSKLEVFIKNSIQFGKNAEFQAQGFNDAAHQVSTLSQENAHYMSLNNENIKTSRLIQAQAEELLQILATFRTVHDAQEILEENSDLSQS